MLQNSVYYVQIMLHKSTIKLHYFTVTFLVSYLNYKIMSISNLSSLAYHQQLWPGQYEKIGFMCTKYTHSHSSTYLTLVVSYTSYVNCIKFSKLYMY